MNRKNKTLLLFFNDEKSKNILLDTINDSGFADARCALYSCNIFFRAIRKLILTYHLVGISFWLGDWKNKINEYDTIVCIASQFSPSILKWIHRKNSKAKLVNYYWDKISVSGYPIIEDNVYENWSFDKQDCLEYGLKYNAQFFLNDLKLKNDIIEYDISFVGADREGKWKNRIHTVDKAYQLFQQYGFHIFFYFVSKTEDTKEYIYENRLTEEQFYDVIAKSKIILEVVQPGMEWITLRPLLALSNGKKVITNNKHIKEEKFYLKENIFILGEDNEDELENFVYSPFKEIDVENMKYYELESWVYRFIT